MWLTKLFKKKELTWNEWFNDVMGNDKELTRYSGGGYEWITENSIDQDTLKELKEEYNQYLKENEGLK